MTFDPVDNNYVTKSYLVVVSIRLSDDICDCLVVISVRRLVPGLFGIADLSSFLYRND